MCENLDKVKFSVTQKLVSNLILSRYLLSDLLCHKSKHQNLIHLLCVKQFSDQFVSLIIFPCYFFPLNALFRIKKKRVFRGIPILNEKIFCVVGHYYRNKKRLVHIVYR